MSIFKALVIYLALFSIAKAESVRIVAFNLESGGAHHDTLAEQMKSLGSVDIWGLSEVKSIGWMFAFKSAVMEQTGDEYWFELGTTGGADRLAILYNTSKLEHLNVEELNDINPGGNVRAPLVVHFNHLASNTEFLAVVNHLYRSKADLRRKQARQLREWAEQQALPVVTFGDFNFDWESDEEHGQGFKAITKDGVFEWIRPDNLYDASGDLISTFCSEEYPAAILDFVFASGEARNWGIESEILFDDSSYCPDDNLSSDHRPVEATIPFAEKIAGFMLQDHIPITGFTSQQLDSSINSLQIQLQQLQQIKSEIIPDSNTLDICSIVKYPINCQCVTENNTPVVSCN